MRAAPVVVPWVVFSGLAQGLIWYREHFFVNISKTWEQAQDYCRQRNANLSTIENAEENAILHNAMKRHAASYSWIGLGQIEGLSTEVNQGWYWVDGDPSGYRNWGLGEPNAYLEHCTEIRPDGRWNNRGCHLTNTFFCYKWQPKIVFVLEKMSWEEALLHCREEHDDLARLLPKRDAEVVHAMANETHTTWLWTSLHFLAGEWLWVTDRNESVREFTQDSLPSCPAQRHSCGARRPSNGQWGNRDCQEKLNFFCYRAQ